MDLAAEAERLQLDVLAVAACAALAAEGVPHVLLKGPSTASWLYDPPRSYRDVDLLVPRSAAAAAARALAARGVATPDAGGLGEVAPHSLLLRSAAGFELDLHVSLPTVPASDDRVWQVLADHVEPLDLGVGVVPQLDGAGRCLVLALHALNSAAAGGQPLEDLRRAREAAPAATWDAAAALADRIAARDLFDAGCRLVRPDGASPAASPRAALYAAGAPSAAFGLERLASARARDLPAMLVRELFPSTSFLRYDDPTMGSGWLAVARAHGRRWRRLVRQLRPAIRAWRTARQNLPPA